MHQKQPKNSVHLFNISESRQQVYPYTVNEEVGLAEGLYIESVSGCKHLEGKSCGSIYFLYILFIYTQDPGQSFAICLGVTWGMLSYSQ